MSVVLPLFGEMDVAVPTGPDPMEQLLIEAYTPDTEEEVEMKVQLRSELVTEAQFPDQSMYILDKQLQALKESLQRMKFYLGDIDDLLPDKK